MKYTADEIKRWETDSYNSTENRWLPTRPENHKFVALSERIKLTWGVFTGKFDVLDWQEKV